MKEVCEYVKTSHKKRSAIHSATVTNGDYCSGLNDREYNRVKVKVKGAGSRCRKYSLIQSCGVIKTYLTIYTRCTMIKFLQTKYDH